MEFEVKGDKSRLAQILNNLITNVLKFTNNGNVDLNVEVREKKVSSVLVYFEVIDRIEKTGFDGYVAKPIDASELLRKIREVLKISSQSV